jgi:hypothetical protein
MTLAVAKGLVFSQKKGICVKHALDVHVLHKYHCRLIYIAKFYDMTST